MSGLTYVFTGDGKGKTSAALGVSVRAALTEKKVIWISYFKGKDWELAEKGLPEKLSNLEMHFTGKGFRISKPESQLASDSVSQLDGKPVVIAKIAGGRGVVVDTATEEQHKEAAEEGLKLAAEKLKEKPFLLVMDEIMNAVSEGLLSEEDVITVIKARGETHLVLTGRSNEKAANLLECADLITECKKVKHPYESGRLAVRGLDF